MHWKARLLSARLQLGQSLSSVVTRFCATSKEIVATHLGMLKIVEDAQSVTVDLTVLGVANAVNVKEANAESVETVIVTMEIKETEWIVMTDVQTETGMETVTALNVVVNANKSVNMLVITHAINTVIMPGTEIGIGTGIVIAIVTVAIEEIELTEQNEMTEEIIGNAQWIEKQMRGITPKIAVWNLPVVVSQRDGEMLKSSMNQISPRILSKRVAKRSQSGSTVSTLG